MIKTLQRPPSSLQVKAKVLITPTRPNLTIIRLPAYLSNLTSYESPHPLLHSRLTNLPVLGQFQPLFCLRSFAPAVASAWQHTSPPKSARVPPLLPFSVYLNVTLSMRLTLTTHLIPQSPSTSYSHMSPTLLCLLFFLVLPPYNT